MSNTKNPPPVLGGEVISVTHITTKQQLAHWTRNHADAPGIRWSVEPGPAGTMLMIEHTQDRSSLASPASGGRPATAVA
jgi:hypothetical protein